MNNSLTALFYDVIYRPIVISSLVIGLVFFIILTSIGKSSGLQQIYYDLLKRVFEYGQKRIEIGETKRNHKQTEVEEQSITSPVKKHSVILKNGVKLSPDPANGGILTVSEILQDLNSEKKEFHLEDGLEFFRAGFEAIIEDEVTIRFDSEELSSWNLLTRTNKNYHQLSKRLIILWALGLVLRYVIFLPIRLCFFFGGLAWIVGCTFMIGFLPEGSFKRSVYRGVSLMCFRILSRVFTTSITYHNKENRAANGVCVANHTSPLDALVLSNDHCYAMVGQSHAGLLGLVQNSLSRATAHVWFEREELRDRELVTKRLREHINDLEKLPILIFPEGTCINNTSVMMFKKGSFEVSDTVYPITIKYDAKYGDAFWNSSKHSYFHYLLRLMSSWMMVCEVWYLPPMTRNPGEMAVDFAKRVKTVIAKQGGLEDLDWDGQLKRIQAKVEFKEKQQLEFAKRLKVE